MSIVLHSRSTTQSTMAPAGSSRLGRLVVSAVLLVALGLAAIGVTQKSAATPARASHQTQLVDGTAMIAPTSPCYGVLAGC